jgi:squalene-hopene/tetraprenyl-beta-curcumene cyclase
VEVSLEDPLAAVRTLLDPPRELGDPSTEDLTGRVLDGLGRIGLTTTSPAVQRAIEFLSAQQFEHGGFWGRWTVNYLASTACVLQGLARVGTDMSEPWIRRAVGFLVERQNEDGGWGELPESYRDPARAGRGPSMPPLTGLVLLGLIDGGECGSPAVARGVAYLLKQQRPDGSWPHNDWLQAIVPPDTFYILAEAAKHYPTEALARYLENA